MATSALESIRQVNDAWLSHGDGPPETSRESYDAGPILSSIAAVVAAPRSRIAHSPLVPNPRDTTSLERSICAIVTGLRRHRGSRPVPSPGPSTLISIDRRFDENLHSDYLCALLSTATAGTMAERFLSTLVEKTGGQAPKRAGTQFAYREVRLDELNLDLVGHDVGARRVDVLVKTPELVLVIENKIWTGESERQTEDYARAVRRAFVPRRRIHLVLSSPRGTRPNEPSFVALSYPDLYRILADAVGDEGFIDDASHLATDYLNTLARLFVHPQRLRLERSVNLLKERGYEL